MELTNKFYLEDGNIENIESYINENCEKDKIVYEVIRVINSVPLFIDEHIKRMENTFSILNKDFPYEYSKIKEFVSRLIKVNNIINENIKITYNLEFSSMKVYSIKSQYPTREMYEKGVRTITYEGIRNNPNAKIIDAEFRRKIDIKIKEKNVYEAILIDNNKVISEGSRSNIFMIKDNKLITSPNDDVLVGITREKVISLAKYLNIDISEERVNVLALKDLQGIFISGTLCNIIPINSVDDINIDVNNPILRNIMSEFDKEIEEYILNNK